MAWVETDIKCKKRAQLRPFFCAEISAPMMKKFYPNYAALRDLGVLFLLAFLPFRVEAGFCAIDQVHARQMVDEIVDGDTLKLTNGQWIRLIGINTPEINHKTHQAQPLADQARKRLQELIGQDQVLLRFDQERQDRHSRQLAHVFSAGGQNLAEQLIGEGLGFHITISPNDWQSSCYQRAERVARLKKTNIWGLPYYSAKPASDLTRNNRGFMLVKGAVTTVEVFKSGIEITLDKKVNLFLQYGSARHITNLRSEPLIGKTVSARGWLHPRKGQPYMSISHPSALEWEP